MKKLLIAFLLFAAAISASIIKPVERLATENNKQSIRHDWKNIMLI